MMVSFAQVTSPSRGQGSVPGQTFLASDFSHGEVGTCEWVLDSQAVQGAVMETHSLLIPPRKWREWFLQMVSKHIQESAQFCRTGKRHKCAHLAPPLGKHTGGCQHLAWGAGSQEDIKLYKFPHKKEQEAWSRCIHRRSEKASESMTGLMEGISVLKSAKTRRGDCFKGRDSDARPPETSKIRKT